MIVAEYIDSLIPLIIGILLVFFPQIFTKSTGLTFENTKKKLKTYGFLLLGVAVLLFIVKIFSK